MIRLMRKRDIAYRQLEADLTHLQARVERMRRGLHPGIQRYHLETAARSVEVAAAHVAIAQRVRR